jgi:hypothetical protein
MGSVRQRTPKYYRQIARYRREPSLPTPKWVNSPDLYNFEQTGLTLTRRLVDTFVGNCESDSDLSSPAEPDGQPGFL